MSDIIMIGIDYEEFEPDTYKSTFVYYGPKNKKEFASGDVVKDFHEALEFAKTGDGFDKDHKINLYNESVGNIVYSSSVDDFVSDNGGKYKFNKKNEIVLAKK